MYLIHNITAAQGGNILGVFNEWKDAKEALKNSQGFDEFSTDWGHFIRIYHPNTIITGGIWTLERSN